MTFRSIVVSNKCYLKVSNNQLSIAKDTETFTVPLEDIACIILNHYAISLSVTLLSECAENNIVIISCDKTHLPNGIFHSYLPHSRQSLVLQKQLNLSAAFKKRLWQNIIESKIKNQANALAITNKSIHIIKKLEHLSHTVLSEDKNNNEAQASRIYFITMFGESFVRVTKNKNHANTEKRRLS